MAAAWLGFLAILLVLLGSPPLTDQLVSAAEQPYAPHGQLSAAENPWSGADVVVVLGGGYYRSDRDRYGFCLTLAASRLLTGVELARTLKPRVVVLGGSVPIPGRPEAVSMSLVQNWVESWGVAGVTVTNLGVCADTHAEAVQFKKLMAGHAWKKIVLVTSALHMRRSEAVFNHEGFDVVPFACDFQGFGVPARFGGFSPFPRLERLLVLSLYLHEKIGWLVYRWRGWV